MMYTLGIDLRLRIFIRSSLLLITLLLGACESENQVTMQDLTPVAESSVPDHLGEMQQIVAKVGDKVITLEALNQSIQLALYDMEWRIYELRYAQLEAMLFALKSSDEITEILLERPQPPRIELPLSMVSTGESDAPVLLSVFCSFQSSHCSRLQPVLKQLNEFYGELISFHYFDCPQSFHRYGKSAANAARCAHEFAIYEPFIDALYMDVSTLNKARYKSIASQLGIDIEAFSLCLDESRYRLDVAADISFAQDLGLGNVPVVFVNGLYTKGPMSFEDYQYYIENELARLGVVRLKPAIEKHTPINDVHTENAAIDVNDSSMKDQAIEHSPSTQRELPVTGKMTLSQSWLQAQLLNQSALETYFHDAEHVVNGMYNLVKLKDVGQQEFYTTLGLKDDDVLMQVNGEWVHSGQNSLWNALAREEPVTLILMRNGYPVRYDYVVGQD